MTVKTLEIKEHHQDHLLNFYDNDGFLSEAVGDFLSVGVLKGEPMVAIVTPPHRRGIAAYMKSRGYDADTATKHGLIKWFDARETLDGFMRGGSPDPRLFFLQIGRILDLVRQGRTNLTMRAFGEMVDILLQDGNPEGALRLEQLWNDIGKTYQFSLLCAYAMGNLYREENWRYFHRICEEHAPLPSPALEAVQRGRQLSKSHVSLPNIFDAVRAIRVLSESEARHLRGCEDCQEVWHTFSRQKLASA